MAPGVHFGSMDMQNQQGHPSEPQGIVLGGLSAALTVPAMPSGVIVFVDGAWDREIAQAVVAHGFAAVLVDLLRPGEEAIEVATLAERLVDALQALRRHERLGFLPVGLFGTELGAAAALVASTSVPTSAVVSRSGRVDRVDGVLPHVQCPTLLLVGATDPELLDTHHRAVRIMGAPVHIQVVTNASAVHEVSTATVAWFRRFLVPADPSATHAVT